MTNSNTDKKIGRLKAGTWGRTSGGYPQSSRHSNAKDSKRRGSKGARRVAKDDLRKVSKRGRLSGDRGLYERISNIIESDPGGDTDKKTMALHNKRIEKEMKKKGIKTNWSVKETAEYLDIPENVVEDIREDKGRGPTGLAYTLAKGHPDAENPKTREKYPERQTPEYKAKWKKRSGPGLKQYTGNKDVMKEQGYHNTTGMDPNDATPAKELEDERSKRLKAMRLNRQKQKGKTQTATEEKYPSSLLLKGNKDAAKKSKAERQDEKQRKLERAKHDTGGFRISDADAKKAKARLKKKYGPYARHFREFNDLQELSPATLKSYTKKKMDKIGDEFYDKKKGPIHLKKLRQAGQRLHDKEYSKTGKPVKNKAGKVVGLSHTEEQQRVVESLSKLMSGGLEKARKSIKAAEKRTGLSVDASKNPIGQIGSFGRPQKKRLAK